MDEARIEVERHDVCGLSDYLTYKWIGKRDMPVYISDRMQEERGSSIPWKFIKIERHPERRATLCIRRDALLPFGFLVIMSYKVKTFWAGFSCRLILTFEIWGLKRHKYDN